MVYLACSHSNCFMMIAAVWCCYEECNAISQVELQWRVCMMFVNILQKNFSWVLTRGGRTRSRATTLLLSKQFFYCINSIENTLPWFLGKTSVARPETQRTKSSPGKGNETASRPNAPQLFRGILSKPVKCLHTAKRRFRSVCNEYFPSQQVQ